MQKKQIELHKWFSKPLGKVLLKAESQALSHLLAHSFGYHLLQLSWLEADDWLKDARIPHRVHLSPNSGSHFFGARVQGDFTELPFFPDSLDVVLLPHVLEFVDDPQQVLQAIDQVLMPNGQLIILGFQPWSLFGLTRLFKDRKKLPWRGKFHSAYRIRAWLREMGYKIDSHKALFFRPLVQDYQVLEKLLFLEPMGQLIWPYLGSVYFIVAKKRVASITPIRASRLKKHVPVPHSVTQPTARVIDDH